MRNDLISKSQSLVIMGRNDIKFSFVNLALFEREGINLVWLVSDFKIIFYL
jgi:hypothetical protein